MLCDGCGSGQDLIAEHSTPNAWKRAKPDQLMCSACHKAKTLRDIRAIWKVKRLSNEVMSQHERRKKFGPQLRGRPFESVWTPRSSDRRRPGDR